jgi:hypothetical protein
MMTSYGTALFCQIKVRKHDMARVMQQNVCERTKSRQQSYITIGTEKVHILSGFRSL